MGNMLVVADPVSVFKIFGFGFLAGSLFSILVLLIFDWIKSRNIGQK
jgi:hypothetical protein